MRRGVEPDSPAGASECLGHERRDASLAVGAPDMNRGNERVRIAEIPKERGGGVEPELDGGGARVEKGERFVVRQGD